MEGPVCYTRRTAADALGVSPPTIDRLIEQGRLLAFRIGEKSVRVPGWSLERFIRQASGSNTPETGERESKK